MSNINHLSIYPLIGNADEIKWSAESVASMKRNGCNAYVMGVNDEDECLFCINPGEEDELENVRINSSEIVAVMYYDHSCSELLEGGYEKWEMLFVKGGKRGQNYLNNFLSMAAENGCIYADIDNRTKLQI